MEANGEESSETPVSKPSATSDENVRPADKSDRTESQDSRRKGTRGPSAGRYQNGRACFSAWFDGEFLVRLRRYATNLGHKDVASLVKADYALRIDSIRLTESDLAELEEVRKSVKTGKNKPDQD